MAMSLGSLPPNFVVSAKGRRFLNIRQTAQEFDQKVIEFEDQAADAATNMSREVFLREEAKYRRPLAPKRPGRPTTGGQFADRLLWTPDGNGNIEFDVRKIRAAAPYFIIQEIGTGQSAAILNPKGSVSVKSQYGRLISSRLVWAAGPGGDPVNASRGASRDQLYFARDFNADSLKDVRQRRKRIRREIKGKHYLYFGGNEGFDVLARLLNEEAKRVFR
jgi:hypothetical protein